MSVVKLLGIEGGKLSVVGLDCLDGTPLLDIKPYFASTDSVPEAVVGWRKRKINSLKRARNWFPATVTRLRARPHRNL